ncbi:MAG: hypothetical protein GZ090_07790 [Oxalobacteraceae bacterium]|nr:hypothetical protein [Oxalobacteraceae bacterium]
MPKLQADEDRLIKTLDEEIRSEYYSNLNEVRKLNKSTLDPITFIGTSVQLANKSFTHVRLLKEYKQFKASVEIEKEYKKKLDIKPLEAAATGKTPETAA